MTARSASGAQTLEAKYYTSQEVYQIESDRIFGVDWLCVGRSSDLSQPGDYFCRSIEGESLIVVRGSDGRMRAFYNNCRHRGTRLCQQETGQFGKAIVCPYHAWAYDHDGRLIAAPNMQDTAGFNAADHSLNPVALATWEGFVFISLAEDPRPFAEHFAPLDGKFTNWQIAERRSLRTLTYEIQANWKMVCQNFNECYHCPRVHPLLNTMSPYRTAVNDLESGPFLGGPMELADDVASMSMDGTACGRIGPQLTETQARRVYYYSLFPSLLLSPHPDYVLVHRLERLDVGKTRIICDILFDEESLEDPERDLSPVAEFWDQVNCQDWNVCELSQQGVASRSYRPGPYSDLESVLVAFDRHYLSVLGEEPLISAY